MAVPKKNQSQARQNKRRANWKGKLVGLTTCTNCNAVHKPHNVCKECGYYNGKQYIKIEAA